MSRDGQILGKMGHTERYGENLFKNIAGEKVQSHVHAMRSNYFRKTVNNNYKITNHHATSAKCSTRARQNRFSCTDDPDMILIHYKDAATAFNNIKKATIENKGVLNNADLRP